MVLGASPSDDGNCSELAPGLMFDDFLPIPDAESLPFYPLVLKLVVCARGPMSANSPSRARRCCRCAVMPMRCESHFKSFFGNVKESNLKKLKLSLNPSLQWQRAALLLGATAGEFLRQTKGRAVFGLQPSSPFQKHLDI